MKISDFGAVDREIMDIAQEECAEVIQAISKIRRFGFDGKHPDSNIDNREHLEEEIGDLMCLFEIMEEREMIDWGNVALYAQKKRNKLAQWSNIT